MRINVFIARATGLSRRAADQAIVAGKVTINTRPAETGDQVTPDDKVMFDGRELDHPQDSVTIMLHKPAGYVVSRNGQGSSTVYDLLPSKYQQLKPVGRLDKDSSGLLLLTTDGQLANRLTHPRYEKSKVYEIKLDKSLEAEDQLAIGRGITLEDGISTLTLREINENKKSWQVMMTEGRNRQIRRTFAARGYTVIKLHRKKFGDYELGDLQPGDYASIVT